MGKLNRTIFRTHYTAAQAFSQTRLDQYLTQIINNGVSNPPGNYGGGVFTSPTPGSPSSTPAPSLSQLLLVEPHSLGIIATLNLGATSHWTQINGTLTSTQYLSVTRAFTTPSGALFIAAEVPTDDAFIARAPAVGEDYVMIFNKAVADDYFGTGATSTLRIQGVAQNPLLPEEVIFKAGNSNGSRYFRVKNETDIEEIKTLTGLATSGDIGNVTFGDFFLTINGDGHVFTFPLDYSSFTDLGVLHEISFRWHARAGVLPTVILPHTSSTGGLRVSLDNMATYTDITGLSLDWGVDDIEFTYKMAVDNTGFQILTRQNLGSVRSAISLDGGSTFTTIDALPVGLFSFAFAGGESLDTRWIAVKDKVYYNEKAGDGDWLDVTGDLLTLYPSFDYVKVILPIGDADFPITPIDPVDQSGAQQDFNEGYTGPAAAADVITQTITNGDEDHAPSADAVYDALANKEDTSNKKTTMTGNQSSNVFYLTAKAIYDWAVSFFAPIAKGVTNGDTHDHAGGDGAQIDHGGLAGLSDDDHAQYLLSNGNREWDERTTPSNPASTKHKVYFKSDGKLYTLNHDGAEVRVATSVLVPLTTSVGGVPGFVWDDDDQLVSTEVNL